MNCYDFLETEEAAALLHRRPNTLRIWACLGTGPIHPIRLNGKGSRLLWKRAEIEKILSNKIGDSTNE